MIWRDAKEKPRVVGTYETLCKARDGGYSTFICLYWDGQRGGWSLSMMVKEVVAWLDPEVPEKYLPEPVKESLTTEKPKSKPKTPLEFEAYLLKEAMELRDLIENEQREKPKGEWVNIKEFNFNPDKYYWAKDTYGGKEPWPDGSPWVLKGSRYLSSKETYWPPIMIWTIPIEEPPR